MKYENIKLVAPLDPCLFSDVAKEAADFLNPQHVEVGQDRNGKSKIKTFENKPTQIRKFYDELSNWQSRSQFMTKEEFLDVLPFIYMMKAKVAYAHGREHVSPNFLNLFSHIIEQVTDQKSLFHAKLFFEAVIGFRKAKEQLSK